eukprot:gene30720-37120_t
MDRNAATVVLSSLLAPDTPSTTLLDTYLTIYRQLEAQRLNNIHQTVMRSVAAELALRKLALSFDFDAFLHKAVLLDGNSKQHEKRRTEYFVSFEAAKKLLGLQFSVDAALFDRAALLFDTESLEKAKTLRAQFEQRLHYSAQSNSAHNFVAALLLTVGIAKMEDMRPILDLAKLDSTSARKLVTTMETLRSDGLKGGNVECAALTSSSRKSIPRREGSVSLRTKVFDSPPIMAPETAMGLQAASHAPVDFEAALSLSREGVRIGHLDQEQNVPDWQRSAYLVWRQHALGTIASIDLTTHNS